MATTKLLLQKPYVPGPKKDTKVLNPKETRLYLWLIVNRDNVAKIKTEHVILAKEWDFKKQQKIERLAGSPEFNKKLTDLKSDTLDAYQAILKESSDIPFSKISELLKEFGKKKEIPFINNNKDFFEVFEEFLQYLDGEVTEGTIKKFKTLKKNLKDFSATNHKYATLSFSAIDHSFKDAYTKYLRNQAPRGRQKTRPEGEQFGLLNDTIGKYVECLKTFCKWATERNYNHNPAYKEFSTFTKANLKRKKQDHDIVTLTLPELKQFYNFDFSTNPAYGRVRDVFCFGAYTGQRWGDISKFKKEDLLGDVWSFIADKTKKQTDIDLIGYAAPALDILKKYNYKLPVAIDREEKAGLSKSEKSEIITSLQNFNDDIKKAAAAAGITTPVKIRRYVGEKEIEMTKPKAEYLGSHTARKTCVSLLLNVYNMNITHVLQITGHSDLKTLQKYINTDRQARREAIGKTKGINESQLKVVKHKAS